MYKSCNMEPATLRGVFPTRPVVHRRNFVRENVRRIKQIATDSVRPKSELHAKNKSAASNVHVTAANLSKLKISDNCNNVKVGKVDKNACISDLIVSNNISHRSMQTEDDEDKIMTNGVIKLPTSRRNPRIVRAGGDFIQSPKDGNIAGDIEPLNIGDNARTNHIRNNIKNLRAHASRKIAANNNENLVPPANYKKGVVPKYINLQKEALRLEREQTDLIDIHCPPGHVVMPENDRKETLRVLRKNYAEKIQEMNSLPVRSDTLKMQKRKINLEQELVKIDEAMKVFQRPKVYVKVNV